MRDVKDRVFISQYIESIKASDKKIWKILTCKENDGTNRSINRIYNLMNRDDTFYIRLDDDVVFIENNFFEKFYVNSLNYIKDAVIFAPIIINNAIISYFLIMEGKVKFTRICYSPRANDSMLWGNALFAEFLHRKFLANVKNNKISEFYLQNSYNLFYKRFSVNAIGIFSDTISYIKNKGISFIPPNVDEEEYITSILSYLTNKPIKIINQTIVSHFSFYPQEKYLLKTGILDGYADLVNIKLEKEDYYDCIINKKYMVSEIKNFFKNLLNNVFGI